MKEKKFFKICVREVKEQEFAIEATNEGNAIALVEEACASGNFDMSNVDGEVYVSSDGACQSDEDKVGKLSLDYNFNVDVFK